MNAKLENVGPCRKLLKVEFSAEEVGKEYAESLAAYAKHGTVKGFRPGRAPAESGPTRIRASSAAMEAQ